MAEFWASARVFVIVLSAIAFVVIILAAAVHSKARRITEMQSNGEKVDG